MAGIALFFAFVAGAGLLHLIVGSMAVYRFASRGAKPHGEQPPVTLLKPLYGEEPLLYEALKSFCVQDYPSFQVVFGVRDAHDPAVQVVRQLQSELPETAIDLVIDATLYGSNRKVSNLINMARAARHDLYVISDSDMHVKPDYLIHVINEFDHPNVGLVTSLYTGMPVYRTVVSDFAVSNINHIFMPSALVGMWLCGRSDCFGATMALRRETLEKIGGWAALSDQLADDFVLGREVKAHGMAVRLAPVLPATTVAEPDVNTLLSHEMRWARTIRAMAPIGSIVGLIQYPVSFALMAVLASGFELYSVELLGVACMARVAAAAAIDRRLGLINLPFWLIPVRDITSFCIVLASFFGKHVQWRGHSMVLGTDGSIVLKEIDGE
jgi:ceramide glucosyltransferase